MTERMHRLVVRHADQIEPHPIKWIWRGRIALGKITVIGGDPGLGKSQLVLHCAAVTTVGGEWPCREGNAPVGSVIIISAEDSAEDTIIPRLMAYGANRDKIKIIDGVHTKEGRRTFSLIKDLGKLEAEIEKIGDVVLIVIDPITVFVGGSSNTAVRRVLAPLSEMAERMGVAVVAVTHSAKAKSKKAIFAFLDSVAFVAAARLAFLVLKDNADPGRLLLLQAKNNLSKAAEGLAFRLEPAQVGPDRNIESSGTARQSR
jgi:putative DNA primase/helicase